MRPDEIKADASYVFKGDDVHVVRLIPGATARSARVHYRMLRKGRDTGTLNVGDEHTIGIVHFAEHATPL